MTDELLALAARVEGAVGADRVLRIDVLCALGLGVRIPGTAPDGSQDGWHNPENDPQANTAWDCLASLDAALSLVPDQHRAGVLHHVLIDIQRTGFPHTTFLQRLILGVVAESLRGLAHEATS